MSKTNRYPTDIMPSMLLETQFNYGKCHILSDKIQDAQVATSKGKKIDNLNRLMHSTIEYAERFIDFDDEYLGMCEEWYKKLGFESIIQKIQSEKALLDN